MTTEPGGVGSPGPTRPAPLARVCFSDRRGGISAGRYRSLNLGDHVGDEPTAVAANRGLLAARVGLTGADLAVMQAVHGRTSAAVAVPGVVPAVDILVTTSPDIGLLAMAADCVPLALVDPVAGVAAAVHSGWRGIAANAPGAAVAAMTELGAHPADITARLGPAICPRCYEVSNDVRDEVAAAAPDAAARTATGSPAVALHAAARQQLRATGVLEVGADPTCTAESADHFSYRRDAVTGRQGVVVRLPERHHQSRAESQTRAGNESRGRHD